VYLHNFVFIFISDSKGIFNTLRRNHC